MGNFYSNLILATHTEGTDGLDLGLDNPAPPLPPSDYVAIYTHHPDWEFPLGEMFSQDVFEDFSLADTMLVWQIHLLSNQTGVVNVDFNYSDGVPDLPTFIYDDELTFMFPYMDNS